MRRRHPLPSPLAEGPGARVQVRSSAQNLVAGLVAIALVLAVALYLVLHMRQYEARPEAAPQNQADGVLHLAAPARLWSTNSVQEVLEDPTGALTLDEVLSAPWSERFLRWPAGEPIQRLTRSALWMRLHVENDSLAQDDFLFQFPQADTDFVSFYRAVEGKPFEAIQTGTLLPFATREIPNPDYLFKLKLEVGQEAWIYLRVADNGPVSTAATIWSQSYFLAYDGVRRSVWGAFYGVLATLALIHFFHFMSLRERAYLALSFWLAGIGLLLASLDGRAHRFLWPGGGAVGEWMLPIFVAWALCGLILFSRCFLDTAQRTPRLDVALKVLLGLALVTIALLPLLSHDLAFALLMIQALPTVAVALMGGLLVLRQGHRPALLYVVAMLLLLALAIVNVVELLRGAQFRAVRHEDEGMVIVLFIFLLALALDDHINALRRESQRMLRELRQSESRLVQYMNAMPMLIDVRTTDGTLVFSNSAPNQTGGVTEMPDMSSLQTVSHEMFARPGSDEPYPFHELPFARACQGEVGYTDDIEVRFNQLRTPIEVWSSPVRSESGEVERVVTAVNNISSRRKTQAELDSLRILYESIVQDQSVFICRFNQAGDVLLANRAFVRFFADKAAALGRVQLGDLVRDAAHRRQMNALVASLTPEAPLGSCAAPYAHEGKGVRWLNWSIRAFFDADNKPSQYQAIAEDITEARQAEEMTRHYQASLALQVEERTRELAVANRSLARRADEIAAITGVAQALASTTQTGPVLQQVAELLSKLFEAHGVGISVYDMALETRALVAWYPPNPAVVPQNLGTAQPIRDSTWRRRLLDERRTVVLARDVQTPEVNEVRQLLDRNDARTLAVIPMLAHSEVVGEIQLATQREERQFAESDLWLMQTIAGQIAASLELGRLLASEQRERLRAEGLHEVVKGINRSLNPAVVMKTVLAELEKVTQHEGSSIWLRDGDDLWMAACTGITLPWAGLRVDKSAPSAANEVIHTRTLVAIDDVRTDPRWVHWFDEYEARSWMGAPMTVEDEVIGVLCIERRMPGVRLADAGPLQALADSAAIAVYNARLFNQVQAVAATAERERLARDLHDAVTQTIFSASILAEALPLQLKTQPHRAQATLDKLQLLTRGALAEMRSLLFELRPGGLSEASLEILIHHLADALSGKSSVATQVTASWSGARVPADVQETFYRVAQEVMNNIAKHAGATSASFYLSDEADSITLQIEDNGRGFDPSTPRPGHFGLKIMQERADAIGARLTIDTGPGAGTRVELVWRANGGESHE